MAAAPASGANYLVHGIYLSPYAYYPVRSGRHGISPCSEAVASFGDAIVGWGNAFYAAASSGSASGALLYRAGAVSDSLSLFFGLGGMSGGRNFMVGASGILLLGAGSGCSGGYSFSDCGRCPKGRVEGFVVGVGFVSSFMAYGGVGHSVESVDFLGWRDFGVVACPQYSRRGNISCRRMAEPSLAQEKGFSSSGLGGGLGFCGFKDR